MCVNKICFSAKLKTTTCDRTSRILTNSQNYTLICENQARVHLKLRKVCDCEGHIEPWAFPVTWDPVIQPHVSQHKDEATEIQIPGLRTFVCGRAGTGVYVEWKHFFPTFLYCLLTKPNRGEKK